MIAGAPPTPGRMFEIHERWRIPAYTLLLILVTILAYLPALRAGFIWDDDYHLTQNPNMVGVDGLWKIWSTPASQYYPLTSTTFWVERQVWGLTPWPYHLVNVLLLATNAALLAMVLRRLGVPGAWLAAAIFALHPIHVESTAWVTELKDMQSGVFYLLAAGAFLRAVSVERVEARRYVVSLVLFVLAVLSKTSTVMLPAVLLLCLWWRDGRVPWRRAWVVVPFFAVSAAAGLYTIWAQSLHGGVSGPEFSSTLPTRVAIAGRIVWFYLGKLLWPHPLIFIYPRWTVDSSQPIAWVPVVALVLVAIALFVASWRRASVRAIAFSGACFFTCLAPVLWLAPTYFTRYSFVGDHFQYLAGMAVIALVGAAISRLPRAARVGVVAVVLPVLAVLTFRQTLVYAGPESLWRHTLANNPGAWMAHQNYGILLLDRGDVAEAESHFLRAIELKPDHVEARLRLAAIAASRNEPAVAERWLREAIAVQPAYRPGTLNYRESAAVHARLALFLVEQGRTDDAIAEYETALRIAPGYPVAVTNLSNLHTRLGASLFRAGRRDEAVAHFREAVAVNPGSADARVNLDKALAARHTAPP
jgi:hypothetical protein